MAIIGYARVSTGGTDGQRLDLQLDALSAAGAEKVFQDAGVSGTTGPQLRPGLTALLEYIRPGDTLLVYRLDRLGRSTRHTLQLLDDLTGRGVKFRSITEGLDTGGPMGKVLVTMLAAFAELERDVIVERTRAGLDAARARGRVGGRPRALTDAQVAQVRVLRAAGTSPAAIATSLNVSRATVYRACGELSR